MNRDDGCLTSIPSHLAWCSHPASVAETLGDSLEQVARGVEHAREDGVALTIRAPPPVAFVSNSQTQSPCSLASRFMMFACWLLK
jgi:hypothetical protein